MKIKVTQADIDNAQPQTQINNCIAIALKRIKKRDDIRAYTYIREIHIGRRKYEMDMWPHNRLLNHEAGGKIEPFDFELTGRGVAT